MMRGRLIIWLTWAAILLAACKSQPDRASSAPPAGAVVEGNRQSELQPGPVAAVRMAKDPQEANEDYIAEGKRLYNQFNCSGCHAAGGGAIGPPLMDDEWIYGSSSANIFWTIVEGRPQGMPAFGGRVPEREVWQIAAFVRSLSGLNKDGENSEGPQHSAQAAK
jgi:cytochrome c oxidase cbb3-type subunit III